MATPTVRGVGAFGSGTTSFTAAAPTGGSAPVAGDALYIIMESTDSTTTAGTPATPTDWDKLFENTIAAGSSVEPAVSTLTIFGKIATPGDSDVVITGVGNHCAGAMIVIAGHGMSSILETVVGTATDHGTSTTNVLAASITVRAGSLIIIAMGLGDDANDTTNVSGVANAALADITERIDQTVSTGSGGGVGIYTATCAGVTVGQTEWDHDTAASSQSVQLGIKPLSLAGVAAQVFSNTSPINGWAIFDTYTLTPEFEVAAPLGPIEGAIAITFANSGTLLGEGALAGVSQPTFANSGTIISDGPLAGSCAIAFANSGTLFSTTIGGTASITFGQDAVLRGVLFASGTATITFSDLAQLNWVALDTYTVTPQFTVEALNAIAGASDITFANSATLLADGALAGTADLTFVNTATTAGEGVLAGAAAQTFGQAALLRARGTLAGSLAVTFADFAQLNWLALDTYTVTPSFTVAAGVIVGTSDIVFTNTATLTADGALAGAAALVFANTGTLLQPGQVVGTSAVAFSNTATLEGTTALTGSLAITFSEAAAIEGWQTLDTYDVAIQLSISGNTVTGVSEITFANTATLLGDGALAGTADITFANAAALEADAQIAGTADIVFTNTATLIEQGAIAGIGSFAFLNTAILHNATPIVLPVGNVWEKWDLERKPGKRIEVEPYDEQAIAAIMIAELSHYDNSDSYRRRYDA